MCGSYHGFSLLSNLLSDQPDFRHLTASAVAAETGFAEPTQSQLAIRRCPPGNGEFPRARRIAALDERVDFDVVVGNQSNLEIRTFTAEDHPDRVRGIPVEVGV